MDSLPLSGETAPARIAGRVFSLEGQHYLDTMTRKGLLWGTPFCLGITFASAIPVVPSPTTVKVQTWLLVSLASLRLAYMLPGLVRRGCRPASRCFHPMVWQVANDPEDHSAD
jgi:hypothetical protein